MNRLSLHHVTAMDTTPAELISIAAKLGLQNVCLFTNITPEAADLFPCVWNAATRQEVAQRCADTGVTAHNLEWFDVFPGADFDSYRKGLELGASLGARRATTHVEDADRDRGSENFAQFCDVAAEYDISPCIEFLTLSATKTLSDAVDIVTRAGKSNGGIALDTLHLFRSGGTVEEIAKLDPRFIRSVQISDGPLHGDLGDYFHEAVFERQIPGEGEFPLSELAKFVAPGMIVDIEVPLRSYKERGVSAFDRAKLAVDGAARVLGDKIS